MRDQGQRINRTWTQIKYKYQVQFWGVTSTLSYKETKGRKCVKGRLLFFGPLSLNYAHQKTAKTSGRQRDCEGRGMQGKEEDIWTEPLQAHSHKVQNLGKPTGREDLNPQHRCSCSVSHPVTLKRETYVTGWHGVVGFPCSETGCATFLPQPSFHPPGTLLLLVPLDLFSWAYLILQRSSIHLQNSGIQDLGAERGRGLRIFSLNMLPCFQKGTDCCSESMSLSSDSLQFSLSREQPFSLLLQIGRSSHLAASFERSSSSYILHRLSTMSVFTPSTLTLKSTFLHLLELMQCELAISKLSLLWTRIQLSLISLGSDHQFICFMVSKILTLRSLCFTFFLWDLFPFSNFCVVSEIKKVDICMHVFHSCYLLKS